MEVAPECRCRLLYADNHRLWQAACSHIPASHENQVSGTHIFAVLNLMAVLFPWINWCAYCITDTYGKKKLFLCMSSTEVGDLQQMQLSQMQPETLQKDKQWRRNGKAKDTADTVKGA